MTKNKKREAKDYKNESVIHTIKVVEALEGVNFEPVKLKTVMDRAGLPYDKCRRVLLNLEVLGWATQTERKEWVIGKKFMLLAQRATRIR